MADIEIEEEEWMPKLYLVTRADLPPGAQACQAFHAAREFQEQHPKIEREWYKNSNHVCMLSVKDEDELCKLAIRSATKDKIHTCFWEPDFGNQLTAICFAPTEDSREFLKDLKLALRQNWYGGVKQN